MRLTQNEKHASKCPSCKNIMDAATASDFNEHIPHIPPKPGDLSVCFYCGTLLRFSDPIHLRTLEKTELDELEETERAWLLRVQQGIIADIVRRGATGVGSRQLRQ